MKQNIKKYRDIINDIILNLCSSIVPIILLQLVIYPYISKTIGETKYGEMLTIIGFITWCSGSLGNALNNTRLLMNEEYKENKLKGDFNLVLIIILILNSGIILAGTIYYTDSSNILSLISILIISFLYLLREYYVVEFRIYLNYKAILKSNSTLIAGYLIGCVVFTYIHSWEMLYGMGLLCSFIYILNHITLYKEPFVKTYLFKKVLRKSTIYSCATFLGAAINYMDRLIIYPLLGGATVSLYYVSTLFGKIISMGITPINGVMLSYYSKLKSFKKRYFIVLLLVAIGIGVIGYGSCMTISKPILDILYPHLAERAMPYVSITTITAMLSMVVSVINPVVLRFCKEDWQIWISVLVTVLYLIINVPLLKWYGLMGFCFGNLAIMLFKLFLLVGIYMIGNERLTK